MSSFLIEPSELAKGQAAGAVIIDARKPGEFKNGHIPGAVPLTTYDAFVPNTTLEGMKTFASNMADRFRMAGVTLERPVVVYEDETGMRAARELWILEYIGHQNAMMLHGGLKQWQAEGNPVIADTDIATVRPKKFPITIASGGLATADEIMRRAGSQTFALIDVRNDTEWAGKDNTPCCKRRGHIPRAKHIDWTLFLERGRFKSPEAIMNLLMDHQITPSGDITVYCHRGARSANTYYALRYAGCMGARNFIGSWHEWSARADLPIEA